MTDYVDIARGYLGTPFRHQARLPGVGLDCAGVVVCALREAGREVEDVRAYGRIPAHGLFVKMVERHCERISVGDLRHGDLIMFAFRGEPQHLAIYTAEGTLIHAYQDVKKVVEHDFDGVWRDRLRGCYRLKEAA